MKRFILMLASLCLIGNIWAYNFKVDGIYYRITSSNSSYTVAVTDSSYDNSYGGYSGAITIPSSVTYGGITYSVTSIDGINAYGAFYNCSGLTSITIPSSVTSIDYNAFYNCSGLTSVTIPSSVTSIGWNAFYNCTSLTSIAIPSSVTSIGDGAFNCGSLNSITVDELNTAYSSEDGVLFNKDKTKFICYPAGKSGSSYTIPESVTFIEPYAFYKCSGLTSVTIPSSVDTIYKNNKIFNECNNLDLKIGSSIIEDYAFENCISLSSVDLLEGVTTIGGGTHQDSLWGAFSGCSNLTSIKFPSTLISIKDYTFSGCEKLDSVIFCSGLTSVGNYAFYNCKGLAYISFPSTLTNMNEYVFKNCSSLKNIVAKGQSPAQCFSTTFDGMSTNACNLHVSLGCGDLYKNAKGWRDFYSTTVEDIVSSVNESEIGNMSVSVESGSVKINGATAGKIFMVYNLQGTVIYQGKTVSDTITIPLPTRGVYVVRIGNKSVKVIY